MSHSIDQRTAALQSRRGSLTRGRLASWIPWAVAAGAIAVAFAAKALLGAGLFFTGVVAGVLFIGALYFVARGVEGHRKATDRFFRSIMWGAFIVALLPLVSVLWTVLQNGLPGLLEPGFLSSSMNGVSGVADKKAVENGAPVLGGAYHALVGTVLITLWTTLISVPIGLLTAIYLVEYGQGNKLSRGITFFVDVMTGIPSIVAGLFAAALFAAIVGPGTRMGIVAAVALSVLMIPVVVRSTEEMLRVVPNELREASYALGVRKWRTIMKVVIPTAISGIASGVTLAIARVIGETAPILVTAGMTSRINANVFNDWMASLPVYIYQFIQNPLNPSYAEPSTQRAWGAALLLILLVMLLNLLSRAIATFFAPKGGR
ncbi:phosphate ABC transporter permease PstA [Falsarthrobacter nasiphocae]|uniref:Phosphate transport system permease protein PstA n=1 Tax=Falsarthrobacter nasiphocae TaxID=189863 RepID=A0AAE3YFT3_9MICC|nr:phosphate ABC transporter permease PstA [Falsarthrobacter nasiphocae]MDR6891947.1 phosphate transport system permease protein [Falsarthrobacter nasiphocae]